MRRVLYVQYTQYTAQPLTGSFAPIAFNALSLFFSFSPLKSLSLLLFFALSTPSYEIILLIISIYLLEH